MFAKEGSSTIGGKRDAPLRKSDRRKLRDRVVEVLFIGGELPAEWITRAEKLIDDAIVAPKGGDVLSRKLKLPGGEHATLYLRTPSGSGYVDSLASTGAINDGASYEDILNTFPTCWPYHQTTQPILLEYEDADRKIHFIPLLPLLAVMPPPLLPSPTLGPGNAVAASTTESKTDSNAAETTTTVDNGSERKYRIPNITVHSDVSKYLCRGADLMKSGIRNFPSPWTLRQSKGLVTISVIGNPQPLAVGMIERGLFREYCYSKNGNTGRDWVEEANKLVGPGKKGVAVTILNCYGDDLWKRSLPSKASSSADGVGNPIGGEVYEDGHYGNKGFVEGKFAYPILEIGEDDEGVVSDENDEADDDNTGDEGAGAVTSEIANMDLSDTNKEQLTTASADEPSADNIKSADEESVPDHDEILTHAFYASLLLLLSSKTPLPMPISTYYAKHLLAAVPTTGPKLDMKQTTYKKIGPFLMDMESNGVIKLGASKDGKDRCAFLTGIVKDNQELRSWKKKIEASGGGASIKANASPASLKMAVVDLFIVPRHISDGLQLHRDAVMAVNAKTDERKGTGFLTKAECRGLIEGYIEKEELVDPERKGCVIVNGPLCDALYRISKKDKKSGQSSPEYPTSVKRKALIERWIERMEKAHAIVQMPGSKIIHLGRGDPKPVDIEVEFRQGNKRKFLTRVRGMEEYGVDGKALADDVSHRFACSSSVEADPVGRPALKKGRVELVFQGHLSEELTALLTGDERLTSHGGVKGSQYNLPKSVINVVLRKGIPARKKR